jgi:hypothetical protein
MANTIPPGLRRIIAEQRRFGGTLVNGVTT